jgi:hypothetical protein
MAVERRRCLGTVAYLGGLPALPELFCWSWGQMLAFNAGALEDDANYVRYDRAGMSLHSMARNELARRMEGDWLLMLDTDHAFEPDLCRRLVHRLEVYGLDVLSGLYLFRSAPHSPVLYADQDGLKPLRDWDRDGLMRIDGAGAGCLMARRTVFERIREALGEEPFDPRPGCAGEDLAFFLRLKALDIPAWVDTRVECPHLRIHPLTLENYPDDWRKQWLSST